MHRENEAWLLPGAECRAGRAFGEKLLNGEEVLLGVREMFWK